MPPGQLLTPKGSHSFLTGASPSISQPLVTGGGSSGRLGNPPLAVPALPATLVLPAVAVPALPALCCDGVPARPPVPTEGSSPGPECSTAPPQPMSATSTAQQPTPIAVLLPNMAPLT